MAPVAPIATNKSGIIAIPLADNHAPHAGVGGGMCQCAHLCPLFLWIRAYQKHGIKHLVYKIYPGGRHEMFNKVNREEVLAAMLGWLQVQIQEAGR